MCSQHAAVWSYVPQSPWQLFKGAVTTATHWKLCCFLLRIQALWLSDHLAWHEHFYDRVYPLSSLLTSQWRTRRSWFEPDGPAWAPSLWTCPRWALPARCPTETHPHWTHTIAPAWPLHNMSAVWILQLGLADSDISAKIQPQSVWTYSVFHTIFQCTNIWDVYFKNNNYTLKNACNYT